MQQFTYESQYRSEKLETYEWDRVWIEHATQPERKRVLYIGDSISCGTLRIATAHTNETLLFDGFGSSKAVDNPFLVDAIKLFARQQQRRDAVLFNNGLHGWHLDSSTEFADYYEKVVCELKQEFNGTPFFIVLTTHVADAERNKLVIIRNEVARKVAEKYDLPVIDYYKPSSENSNLLSADGVHFVDDGYKLLAKTAVDAICEKIPGII